MDNHPSTDSDGGRVVGRWTCKEDGWWYLSSGRHNCKFRFAEGTSLPDVGGPPTSGDDGCGGSIADEDSREMRNALAIATGLRVTGDSLILRVLEMADDPVPRLVHLELGDVTAVTSESILTGMRAGKFAKLKFIKWGVKWGQVSSSSREAGIQGLSECIRMGRFLALSGLWVSFGYENNCSESTVNALVTSLECIGSLRSLSLIEACMARGHKGLLKIIRSGGFCTLEELDLARSAIGDAGCQLYGEAINEGYLENLRTLHLMENEIGDEGLEALSHGLKSDRSSFLRVLDLGSNQIKNKGLKALSHALKSGRFSSLQELELRSNKFGDEGLEALSCALESGRCSSLQKLILSRNQFGDEGMEALSHALESGQCSSLRVLYLGGNQFGNNYGVKGLEALLHGLESGRIFSLEKLDISFNPLGDEGLEALSCALKSGRFSSLQELFLILNQFGDQGLQALSCALETGRCSSLRLLNLGDNQFGDEGLKALLRALESGRCSSLRVLNLGCNQFGDTGLEELSRALESGRLNGLCRLWLIGYQGEHLFTEKGVKSLVAAFVNNPVLVTDVMITWEDYPELGRRWRELVRRNRENARISAALEGKKVPATFSKVFLCGYPEVGKTTLRKSLQPTFCGAMCLSERVIPRKEKPTRGIQTSHLVCKGQEPGEESITMVVWDLAGQEEYHLIHNAFFSGLTFPQGSAVLFVIVCNDSKDDQSLVHWLQFIASSCGNQMNDKNRRHVLVVLNCMNGRRNLEHLGDYWEDILEREKEKFKNFIEIERKPFIVDVRRSKLVKALKSDLLDQSKRLLKHEKVPEICLLIQSKLNTWSQEQGQFPVLNWTEFVEKVTEVETDTKWPESLIEAAMEYLNQVGIVIFINQVAQVEWGISKCKLVVLDPNLLCTKVLGDVFLVPEMTVGRKNLFRNQVDKNMGSISSGEFRKFFQKYVSKDSDYEDLVSIMMYLGLCYKDQGQNREQWLIFPALLNQDNAKADIWDNKRPHNGYQEKQWVMGFSVEHQQEETSIAPMALWNRFQVDLAQSPEYGQSYNGFVTSKEFMTFVTDDMTILIQVKQLANQQGTFEGIDVFVKPLLSACEDKFDVTKRAVRQVDLARELVERLLRLWDRICPGVKYVERVVWPWPAGEVPENFCDPMERNKRNVKVAEVRAWVRRSGPEMSMESWGVGNDRITAGQLLSSRDMGALIRSMEEANGFLEANVREAEVQGVFPLGVLGMNESGQDISIRDSEGEALEDRKAGSLKEGEVLILDTLHSLKRIVVRNHKSTKKRLEDLSTMLEDLSMVLSKVHDTRNDILRKIQDVETIFSHDREYPCPRFIYLGEEKSGAWVSLKKALSVNKTVHVHFFCEAGFDDYRLHPVANQAGIDIKGMKDWYKAVAPWLKVSLTVFFITSQTASNVVAPGAGSVMSGFNELLKAFGLTDSLAVGTGYAKKELDAFIGEGPAAEASSCKDRPLYGRCKAAMTEFLKLSCEEYQSKLGLLRVKLYERNGDFRSVSWVCDDCYKKYAKDGRRVRDFFPG